MRSYYNLNDVTGPEPFGTGLPARHSFVVALGNLNKSLRDFSGHPYIRSEFYFLTHPVTENASRHSICSVALADLDKSFQDFSGHPYIRSDGTNHNGRIDGDNGDGIKTSNEAWDETSPTLSDSDNDGFRDDLEWENDMDPRTQDTDHDGLLDQEEDVDLDFILDSGETDPSKFDTDGDGLSDKTEITGWTICIIREATGEEVNHYTVSSNPREVHSDTDTLTDYQEFQNCTDPTEDDTDGDGKNDYEELTYDFSSSPTGIDGQAPTISYFDCSYEGSDEVGLGKLKIPTKLKLIISITVKDIFGLDKMSIHIDHLEDNTTYIGGQTSYSNTYEWTISGFDKIKKAVWDGFKINVTVYDVNSNFGWKEQKQDGIAKLIIEAMIGDIVNRINKIKVAFSSMYSWVITNAENIFNNILIPLTDTIFSYIDNIYISFDYVINDIFNLLMGTKISFQSFLYNVSKLILSLFEPFIDIISAVADVFQPIIDFLLKFKDLIESTIRNGIETILNLFLSIFGDIKTPDIVTDLVYYALQGRIVDFLLEKSIPILISPLIDQMGILNEKMSVSLENTVSTYNPDGGYDPMNPPSDSSPLIDALKKVMGAVGEVGEWIFTGFYVLMHAFQMLAAFLLPPVFFIKTLMGLKELASPTEGLADPEFYSEMEKIYKSFESGGSSKQYKAASEAGDIQYNLNKIANLLTKPGFGLTLSLLSTICYFYSFRVPLTILGSAFFLIVGLGLSSLGTALEIKSPWPLPVLSSLCVAGSVYCFAYDNLGGNIPWAGNPPPFTDPLPKLPILE